MNWPSSRVSKADFRASAVRSGWIKASANVLVSFKFELSWCNRIIPQRKRESGNEMFWRNRNVTCVPYAIGSLERLTD